MTRRRLLTIALLTAVAAGVAWRLFGTHVTPAGQPALMTLDASSFGDLRTDFNLASGQVRMVLLLSPT